MTESESEEYGGVEHRYGGLLLQKCREAVEKYPEDSPILEDWALDDLVGWVMVESEFHASRGAARDCLQELMNDE